MKKQIIIAALAIALTAAALPSFAQSPLPEFIGKQNTMVEDLIYQGEIHQDLVNLAIQEAIQHFHGIPPIELPDPRVYVTERDGALIVEFLDPGNVYFRSVITNADLTPIADGDEIQIRTVVLQLQLVY